MRHALLVLCLAACTEGNPVETEDAGLIGGPEVPPESAWDGGATTPPESPPTAPPQDRPPPAPPQDAGPQPADPPQDPPPDPNPQDPDPSDPDPGPADPPPAPVDECADAGDACNTCACRLCAAELDACFADPLCQAVVDCARRTGCGGLDCLQSCGAEIDAAGGPFSPAVGKAQAVSDCRDNQCGTNDAECQQNDPGPPQPPAPPEPDPNDPNDPNDPDPADPPDPNDPPNPPNPPAGDCARFPADEFCGEGVDANGTAWCEFYVESDGDSCDEVCARAGSFCLTAFDDEDGGCEPDNRVDCDDGNGDQICRCAR